MICTLSPSAGMAHVHAYMYTRMAYTLYTKAHQQHISRTSAVHQQYTTSSTFILILCSTFILILYSTSAVHHQHTSSTPPTHKQYTTNTQAVQNHHDSHTPHPSHHIPPTVHLHESASALHFASAATRVIQQPQVNEIQGEGAQLKRLQSEIKALRQQLVCECCVVCGWECVGEGVIL